MPKSKKKPAPTRKKQKSYDYPGGDVVQAAYRHPKVSLIVTILVVGLLGWWGVRAVATELQFRQDKKQYAATEASMAKVYDQMVAVAGEPAESHLSKTCGHVSLKYETGPLFCDITYDFFYPINGADEGKAILDKLEPYLGAYSKNNAEIEKLNQPDDMISQKQNYHVVGANGLGCSLVYESQAADRHNLAATTQVGTFRKTTPSALAAEFVFDCSSFPVKPIYKVTN